MFRSFFKKSLVIFLTFSQFFLSVNTAEAKYTVLMSTAPSGPTNTANATSYNMLSGTSAAWLASIRQETMIADSGTASNFTVKIDTAPGAGASWVFTVMHYDGTTLSATNITCTISDPATTCSDSTNTKAIVAGERIFIRAVASATAPAAAGVTRMSILFTSNTYGNTILSSSNSTTRSTTSTEYDNISGASNSYQTTANVGVRALMPTSGTIKSLYVASDAAPDNGGGTQEYVFTVQKNAADTALTCTMSETAKSCNDTTHSFTVAQYDDLLIKSVPSASAPAAGRNKVGVIFVPDIPGEFIATMTSIATPTASATTYVRFSSGKAGYSATEADNQNISSVNFGIKTMVLKVNTTPGFGESIDITPRINGNDLSTCPLSGGDVQCTLTLTNEVAVGDLLTTKFDATNSTITDLTQISYTLYYRPRRRTTIME